MIIKLIVSGDLENNNYLVIDEKNKVAIMIDCTAYRDDIKEILDEYGAKLEKIFITHGHFDHILGINETKEKLGEDIEVYISKKDIDLVQNIDKFVRGFSEMEPDLPQIDEFVNDADVISVGDIEVKVLETPGHSKGGVCYLVNDEALFSGDTLFCEEVGRCDLYGGNFKALVRSIKTKILTLDDDVKIYTGHGEITSVGYERKFNEYLR